ncbi:hypothetical protein TrST_g9929 [Triparma strigata]|uniref:Prokaryotic-type class I peptide chain release factors domain-containing protein n=1 Tax=Triparma strigata TaxID=1606541 RepID=A0A9W7AAW5_9STRA|nr:hypothetical protein TrST_g9929 [Triparma strigata]
MLRPLLSSPLPHFPRSISSLPPSSYTLTFSRSQGSGGQNVNKLNTRVTLKLDLSGLPYASRIKEEEKGRVSKDDFLQLTSQVHRTQYANKKDVLEKLQGILDRAREPVKVRKERGDVITQEGKGRRRKEKSIRKGRKENRRFNNKDYD